MKTKPVGKYIPIALILTAIAPLVQASDAPAAKTTTEDTAEPHLYMDVHELGPGNATAEGVADAHEADLRVQGKYGVEFLRYWVDEDNGRVYCLSKAPNAEAVVATHRAAHGLIPTSVAEVTGGE